MKIPYDMILLNMPNIEFHEIIYHEGNWRIKIRILKKSDRRTWNNDKG